MCLKLYSCNKRLVFFVFWAGLGCGLGCVFGQNFPHGYGWVELNRSVVGWVGLSRLNWTMDNSVATSFEESEKRSGSIKFTQIPFI